jgi:drug/metabolite transporter (DMT)-like permease
MPSANGPARATDWVAYAALIGAMIFWASSFVALKIAFRSYDPMVVIFGRMAVATLCFLAVAGRFRRIRVRREDVRLLAFMVFCEPCLYFLLEAKAVENTTASQAGMITAMLPLMVAVAARVFLKESLSRRTLAGFALAVAGACWLSAGAVADASAPNPVLGNLLEFGAMVCATGYFISLKRLTAAYPPLFLTAFQALVGSLFYFPILFLPSTARPAGWDPVGLMAIGYLGAFVTLGGYGLYNFGVSRIPVSRASAFVNLIPAFAVIMGWLILGERFTAAQYLASAVIFVGVFLSQDA